MNNLRNKAALSVLLMVSLGHLLNVQLTAFLPLLGIVTYFLPNIKEKDV